MTLKRRIARGGPAPVVKTKDERPHHRIRRKLDDHNLMDGRIVDLFDHEDTPAMDMLRKAPHPPQDFRGGEYIHVSDLINKCVRKIALSEEAGLPMPVRSLSHSSGLTFAQGDAIHDYVKQRFAERYADSLYGRWSCLCGKTVSEDCVRTETEGETCESCGTDLYRYQELVLRHPALKIVGSPDVTLYMRRKACLHPVEIKSINHEEWKTLPRAKPDHVLQVLFYWFLLRELGYSVSDTVSVLYVTKGFVFKGLPYREFVIDAQENLHLIDDYREDAKNLVQYRSKGILPPRSLCSNQHSTEAKACHVVGECFRRD